MSENQKKTKPNVPNLSVKREQKELQIHSAERETNVGRNVPNLRFPGFEGEWKECRNEDLGKVITGNTPPTAETRYYENGYKLWASPADLSGDKYISRTQTRLTEEGFSKTRVVPQGTTLVTCIGSTIGKMGMASQEMSTNQQINSVIPYESTDGQYLYYAIQSQFPRYVNSIAVQAVPIISKGTFEKLKNYRPNIDEQRRIGSFLDLLDRRITIQNKVIEDLKKLKTALCDRLYNESNPNCRIGDIIEQLSARNKDGNTQNVLSVSNRYGFISQAEQFEERSIASEDTTNYKVVRLNDFAYNPARINVGSIARLKSIEKGIVSPMYICFRCGEVVLPEFLEQFFSTKYFSLEVGKRLEGSVRMCLSFEGLCNIPISLPSLVQQKGISEKINCLNKKFQIEENYLFALLNQKQYLLSHLFI